MKKFIVTGSMRSGTTFTASILNSQEGFLCLEDYPWRIFPENFTYREEFLRFSAHLYAKFIYLGLPEPHLAEKATVNDDLIDLYIHHLKRTYGCENIGFKRTMMTASEIFQRIEDDYKIIIVKRDTQKILKSWVRRINSDIHDAAEKLQEFLEQINYYNLHVPSDALIVIDFDEMLGDVDKTLKVLSEFLDVKLQYPTIRYHSFNKNRAQFFQNSSYVKNFSKRSMALSLKERYKAEEFQEIAALVESGRYRPRLKTRIVRFMKDFYMNHLN